MAEGDTNKELAVLATLVDCKDCGSRPEIKEYVYQLSRQYYITCPNKKCKIRQSTPEGRLEDVAKIWNRVHKRKI